MMTPETFRACAEQAGYVVRCYSGRGMYGRQCMAIDRTENGESIFSCDLVSLGAGIALFAVNTYDVDHDDVIDALSMAETDGMGTGIVVYWPIIPWDGDGPTNNDDEDDGA